jgi:hypothetical protein
MEVLMRYFRTGRHDIYEATRLQLDAAWGLPSDGQQTCYEPLQTSLRDSDGRILLAVDDRFCDFDPVAALLPTLLGDGSIEEITHDLYHASLPAWL